MLDPSCFFFITVRALSMQNKYYPQAEFLVSSERCCVIHTFIYIFSLFFFFFVPFNFRFIRILVDRLSCFLNAFITYICDVRLFTCCLIFSKTKSLFCTLIVSFSLWTQDTRHTKKKTRNRISSIRASVYLEWEDIKNDDKEKTRTLTKFSLSILHFNTHFIYVHHREITKEAKWASTTERRKRRSSETRLNWIKYQTEKCTHWWAKWNETTLQQQQKQCCRTSI